MSTVSGATKQVIIPPSNDPVTSQKQEAKPKGTLENKIAELPNKEKIRHETILANMLLTCKLDDKGHVVEDPKKRDVSFGATEEALTFLRGHEEFKELLERSNDAFVKMPNGELMHKDLVGKPHHMLPASNLPYHPDDTRARQIR